MYHWSCSSSFPSPILTGSLSSPNIPLLLSQHTYATHTHIYTYIFRFYSREDRLYFIFLLHSVTLYCSPLCIFNHFLWFLP